MEKKFKQFTALQQEIMRYESYVRYHVHDYYLNNCLIRLMVGFGSTWRF